MKIVDHKHCPTYDKAIPPNKEFCSEECGRRYEEARMKERKMMWIIYAVMIAPF